MFMFMAGLISEDVFNINRRTVRASWSSEDQYFYCESVKLSLYGCPNCHGTDCLFKGFFSIGCRDCLTYMDLQEVVDYNAR